MSDDLAPDDLVFADIAGHTIIDVGAARDPEPDRTDTAPAPAPAAPPRVTRAAAE